MVTLLNNIRNAAPPKAVKTPWETRAAMEAHQAMTMHCNATLASAAGVGL